MKKDFVRQDWAEEAAKKAKHGTTGSNSSADATSGTHEIPEVKSKRPRSRTFTLSRGSSKDTSSAAKPTKPEGTLSRHSRTKSSESVKGDVKSFAAVGTSVAQTLIAKAKGQTPDDFVTYLRKNQKPELVEVGRLHKLRLLLRNETVAWTDEFVGLGGMEEIVGLLHRTMEVEWREEHEDALLHEVLLCLKALATTALALHHLNKIQVTLFPALLHMLFDEEKKGPSEFTTRNIISYLLFAWLKAAPVKERTLRAKTLLSYLRNQEASESQRPVDFVLEMRRPRPYTIWYKEVSNVTKEVFWIFLHNLNVISLPKHNDILNHDNNYSTISSIGSNSSFDSSNPYHIYMAKHFPQELPPVPAAPYVGGVEWDATNYISSHLDLVNGILACLPTQMERNTLRDQMRISGWEKVMGSTLRLCKEKFYGGVHAGLRCWVAAAAEDGWDTRDVRCGPCIEKKMSPKKSPTKTSAPLDAPKIEMKLSFAGEGKGERRVVDDGWL
ncbi:putative GTPase-binding protein rid1 [Glarea lozoyensis 74030]|nr:putative GTPase-binding protein rid1 [Glarea lozoyensis 74030]